MVYKRSPHFDNIRVFGCLFFAAKLNVFDKFYERSEKCVLIDYSNEKKRYKLYSIDNRTYFFSKDVKFYESVFPYKMTSRSDGALFDEYFSNSCVPWDPFPMMS